MQKVAIVTDSTADLSESYYKEHNVIMVPLSVRFDKEFYKDWIEIGPKDFYAKLKSSPVIPKTSQPTVAEFKTVYEGLAEDYDAIISIHLSGHLSGTIQSAQIAASGLSIPIIVIDGEQGSLATGLLVDLAVRARDGGGDSGEIAAALKKAIPNILILFMVDTLKYLHLGGRIGGASALVGSLLNMKPILTLQGGVVAPFKKLKGAKKAMGEIVEEIKRRVDTTRPYYLILAGGDADENVAYLNDLVKREGLTPSRFIEGEIGPVIGAYLGPGAVAAIFYQDPS